MTELLPGPGGIVLASDCVTLIDTRSMPWEPWAGNAADRIKRLVTGPGGEALVYLAWFGPRTGDDPPSRTFHRSVREFGFVLSGELATWEYESRVQQHGDLIILRDGYFVDRRPMSLHGTEPGFATEVACTMLCWREGPGAGDVETVPYAPDWKRRSAVREHRPGGSAGRVRERDDVTILDTRQMGWEAFDGIPGGRRMKVLARFPDGTASAHVSWAPPGLIPGLALPRRHYHRTVTENFFILDGELPHWEYADRDQVEGDLTMLRAGWYMQRRPGLGGLHGSEQGRVPESRFLLSWRDGTGNYVAEPDWERETVEVPFPKEEVP